MKGITCSEAKDILDKLNRLERLRQGTKTEMAEVCKEPEKGINPFADEFKDMGEQILPEKNGIFWSLYRFFLCKHLWWTGLGVISILMALDTPPKYWIFIPIAWIIVLTFFGLWFWAGSKLNPLTPEQNRTWETLYVMEKLKENNGKIPKGMTKEQALGAVNDMALTRYKYLKKKGRI
ncbi:MAG: hypothetical protein LBQ76_02100 [Candidatus Fibromonas sp.]|jgi:hypothetical protein|nr:hypothetical protein [Candidatus Fibromonas sp.]